jgi:GNAT superfamily N-acetyltransferase
MTDFAIRAFSPADGEACTGIFDRAWHAGHAYAPRQIGRAVFEAETQGERILVAEADGLNIVGFVSIHEPAGFIHHLYVDPDRWGLGIGAALLERALALASGKASLKCQVRNSQAMAFYRRHGWTPSQEGEGQYGPWVLLHSP